MNNVDVLQPPTQSNHEQTTHVTHDSTKRTGVSPITGYAPPHAAGNEVVKALAPRSKLRQILQMQKVMFDQVMKEETEPQDKASLVRSWDLLEDRIRILRGHLKAGSVNESRKGPDASKPEKQVKGQIINVKAIAQAMKSGENSDAQ